MEYLALLLLLPLATPYALLVYSCAKDARSIFVQKGWNPGIGVTLGILLGLVTGILGWLIIRLAFLRTVIQRKKYSLYRGGPKRLEVTWTYGIKNMTIILDGREIGQINSLKEAKKGRSFKLPDRSNLAVRIGGADDIIFRPNPLPDLELNGIPIPDSVNDPAVVLNISSKTFIVGGISTMLLGILVTLSQIGNSYKEGYGSFLFVIGIIAIIAGIHIQKRSKIAIETGFAIAILSAVNWFLAIGDVNILEGIYSFINALIFIFGLRKTRAALKALKNEDLSQHHS